MSVRVGVGVSTEHDPLQAALEASGAVSAALGGEQADLAVVFASGAHLAAPEATLEGVHTVLAPRGLIGCGAGGVLGARRELEAGTAVAVWAATFEGNRQATPFHVDSGLHGLPSLAGAAAAILLTDPLSFSADAALMQFANEAPAVPVLGGIASARTQEGAGALFLGEEVCERGAVGVTLEGIEMLACVSQGAVPLGREITITAAEGNVIHELAGRPALETVEHVIAELSPRERALTTTGILLGIVIDSGRPDYGQGDFLVRGIAGADSETGRLVVGAMVEAGQVVRLHARDAKSADEDLRRALQLQVQAMTGAAAAGALVFSCNGRGRAMFGAADHDAKVVDRELHGAPAAGFFAAGEIGPVGGRSFLHGFTATLAVFPERSPARVAE